MGERRRTQRAAKGGKCDARASPTRRPTLCDGLEAGGGRGAAAHRLCSEVSSPSCEGRLPVRSLLERVLREGRRSGRSWGNGDGQRGRQVRRACFPYLRYAPPLSVPSQPLSCHGLEAGLPSCGGSQVLQRGEQPELRGYAAGQVVVGKGPARGAPEREIMGERRRTQRGASATRAAAPTRRHPPYLRPPPTLCHGLEAGGGRGAAAHSAVRMVSSPSCVGTPPVRP